MTQKTEEIPRGLVIRKLANTSEGERVKGFHPFTGGATLINPVTANPEPWPLAGVTAVGEVPKLCKLPMKLVAQWENEGWAVTEGTRIVHAPGGPQEDPWRVTHTFVEMDALTLNFADGAVRYRVTHQPGKHADPSELSGYRIDWFYVMRKEG